MFVRELKKKSGGKREFSPPSFRLLFVFYFFIAIYFMGRGMLVTDGRTETVTLKDIDSYESRDVELLPTTHWLKYKVNVVVEDKCELMGF